MSPERILGSKYSYPSDIWSLGLCFLECALGQFPYPASNVYIELMTAVGKHLTWTIPFAPLSACAKQQFHPLPLALPLEHRNKLKILSLNSQWSPTRGSKQLIGRIQIGFSNALALLSNSTSTSSGLL